MSEAMISVENLSKCYLVGHQSSHRDTHLRDVIGRLARNFVRKTTDLVCGRQIIEGDEVEEYWALKDVTFEVRRGEVLGVIGRNGAGKSTLLKILSRITEPSRGQIRIKGRVGSLLEVGTGFHPELTGRENIYLNAAILGLARPEVRRRFDEIVAFSGVEKFIDTPVKRYSSGMYMRLAFAIAAHMDSEILIVDEVLAVGDAEFQKKCLGKMKSISTEYDRTVIFVSHQMSTVSALCSEVMWLSDGRVVDKGNSESVVKAYVSIAGNATDLCFEPKADRATITRVALDSQAIKNGDFIVDIYFESPYDLNPPVPGIGIFSMQGVPIFGSNTRFHPDGYASIPRRSGKLRFEAKGLPLVAGTYVASVWLGDWQMDHDRKEQILQFNFPSRSLQARRPGSEALHGFPSASVAGHLDWPVIWTAE